MNTNTSRRDFLSTLILAALAGGAGNADAAQSLADILADKFPSWAKRSYGSTVNQNLVSTLADYVSTAEGVNFESTGVKIGLRRQSTSGYGQTLHVKFTSATASASGISGKCVIDESLRIDGYHHHEISKMHATGKWTLNKEGLVLNFRSTSGNFESHSVFHAKETNHKRKIKSGEVVTELSLAPDGDDIEVTRKTYFKPKGNPKNLAVNSRDRIKRDS
jgi:hypothetical protein